MSKGKRVVVIGAGVAGLACARELSRAGNGAMVGAIVLDKGRGVGGRCATRRAEVQGFEKPVLFDHGPARFERLPKPLHDELERAGVIEADTYAVDQFRCVAGNSSLCRYLADGLDVRTGVEVKSVERVGETWKLVDQQEKTVEADLLILAIPVDQVRVLLTGQAFESELANVRMKPVWAGLVALDSPVKLMPDGVVIGAVNVMRDPRAVVLHATDAWTRANLERTAEEAIALMMGSLESANCDVRGRVVYASAHRWRYALTDVPLGKAYLWDEPTRLGVCGDWCQTWCQGSSQGSAGVSDAAASGLAMAAAVLARQGANQLT